MTTTEHAADDASGTDAPRGVTSGPSLRVSDPTRVRALAHPVRMDLLQFLDDVGEATATECAEHLGQTVANCSFHLRTLAKAGYIEPAEPRGRERPWRVVARERNITPDPLDPASRRAVLELGEISVRREAERYIDHLRHVDHDGVVDPGLIPLTQLTTSAFWATPEETAELIEGLHALMKRFDGRTADPARRPGGARMMRLFTAINPDMAFEPTAEAAPAPQQED
ncbi:ArsR/SmtB family transcription factor [Cellulomonas pakistanensis]|uniref:Transcriptional regulator n=1 Tax=Cellulomonas pakistanensis TaxID=992287 RepID=A0A919U8I2_9CELL|nr:winged helix-turn-helix domain-containing protein [Cellulomonas pakistanensis]GIG37947.1 transcriptional regulator [Cellulomonas pakistanensis]